MIQNLDLMFITRTLFPQPFAPYSTNLIRLPILFAEPCSNFCRTNKPHLQMRNFILNEHSWNYLITNLSNLIQMLIAVNLFKPNILIEIRLQIFTKLNNSEIVTVAVRFQKLTLITICDCQMFLILI